MTASNAAANQSGSKEIGPLKIPGFGDLAVKEYGEWLASTLSDDTLKAAFRQASDMTLSDGFDLMHIYKDQNPVLRANSIQEKRVQFRPNSKYEEERKKEKLLGKV